MPWSSNGALCWPELSYLQNNPSELARAVAIFFWDDVMEHMGPAVVPYSQHFLPFMLQGTVDDCVEIRQVFVPTWQPQ